MQQMDRYLYQASQQALKAPPTNHASDQWLDRLTLDGFPIRQILASIFMRYRQDSVAFGKYITRRAASLKNSKYKVKNFIPRLPITMEVSQIIPLLMDKYRISADGAKLLLQDYLWIYQDQSQVFSQLARRGMTVLKHQQGRTYNSVFFCNDQMRSNFQRFGDVICVDFKHINIRNDAKKKNSMIGVFTGQDTNLHHTLFGIAIISEEKQENYLIAVKQFLKAMKTNQYPQSFIVGNCELLYQALSKLSERNKQSGKQYFGCLVGWHNLMDRIAKLYKSHEQRELIMQKFGNILSSLNRQQMRQKIRQLLSILKNDQNMINFINRHSKYFVAHNQPSFIGFGIEKDNFSMLYKIMYNFLREAESIGFVFQQTLKMEQMLLGRIKKGYQLLTQKEFQSLGITLSDELRYLSIRLERKLFKKFLIMYRTAVKHAKLIAVSPDGLYYQIAFKSQKKIPYRTYIYTVHYVLQQNCWKCNCGFIYESGIPCAHLIKIIRKFRGSLTYYINRRWMIQNNKFNPESVNHPSQLRMRPQKEESDHEQVVQSAEGEDNRNQQIDLGSSDLNQQEKQMMMNSKSNDQEQIRQRAGKQYKYVEQNDEKAEPENKIKEEDIKMDLKREQIEQKGKGQ